MKKVITYGTYDMLHYGHLRLLERAKKLGDYLIVGITSEDFDKRRGKINVKQSLAERYRAVEETGLADEIIIEEYEGQKIDDVIKYGVDIFTVGSDWKGKFDYLNEFCEVVYLPRTKNISSSKIRKKINSIKIGAIGSSDLIKKHIEESKYINGLDYIAIFSNESIDDTIIKKYGIANCDSYEELLMKIDAVFIQAKANEHYEYIKKALLNKKHVLCESPIVLTVNEYKELQSLAKKNNVVLMEAIKTNYSTAFSRLILLAKSGCIGDIISVDCNCTSLKRIENVGIKNIVKYENSINDWGPTALLPIFKLLGKKYIKKYIFTIKSKKNKYFDYFTKIDFIFENAVASMKVGKGVKSEGELIISGTKGYIYVPAPWWKTDYFEVRYENIEENRRYFYQLEGEGIRYELNSFVRNILNKKINLEGDFSEAIVSVMEDYYNEKDVTEIFW